MSFYNISFPVDIAKIATGGPEFLTNVVSTFGGTEFVQQISKLPRVKYTIESGAMSYDEVSKLVAFFRICNGKIHSFKFKDWTDFKANKETPKRIDDTYNKFQLIKTYSFIDTIVKREITAPIQDSVDVFINNTQLAKDKYSVSESGVLSIFDDIASSNDITVDFDFEIKMRFDCDKLDISPNSGGKSYTIKNVSLIEII